MNIFVLVAYRTQDSNNLSVVAASQLEQVVNVGVSVILTIVRIDIFLAIIAVADHILCRLQVDYRFILFTTVNKALAGANPATARNHGRGYPVSGNQTRRLVISKM
jgi:hypothetical protein